MGNLQRHLDIYKEAMRTETSSILETLSIAFYQDAVDVIEKAVQAGNRLHITGIGKPGHLAGYIASLIASTGTPAYFLHGTEAVHGSCGQLVEGDVVICISNSGETVELKATAMAIRNNGCKVIAVTGNDQSWLAQFADVHLTAHIQNEGGPLGRAPRSSIMAEMIVLQGLSVVLQSMRDQSVEQYIRRHPGGALGQLREHEK